MKTCDGCGVEKDINVKELYPYPDKGRFVEEPIDPLLTIDCEPWEGKKGWRRVTVCHNCYHKLDPDMWISSRCWEKLKPITPFEKLPVLEETNENL